MHRVDYIYQEDSNVHVIGSNYDECFPLTLLAFVEYCYEVYGTSLENNKGNCKYILQETQNLPICFSIHQDLIFLPTKSLYNKECILVNSSSIQNILVLSNRTCRIYFNDGLSKDVNCSKTTILKQIARAHQIRSYYKRNISPLDKLRELYSIE